MEQKGNKIDRTLKQIALGEALVIDIDNDSLDASRVKLEYGADPNATDRNNRVILISASLHGHMELVRLLLENSANVHTRDQFGQTAIHAALHEDHEEIADLLGEHGARTKREQEAPIMMQRE